LAVPARITFAGEAFLDWNCGCVFAASSRLGGVNDDGADAGAIALTFPAINRRSASAAATGLRNVAARARRRFGGQMANTFVAITISQGLTRTRGCSIANVVAGSLVIAETLVAKHGRDCSAVGLGCAAAHIGRSIIGIDTGSGTIA